MKKEDISRVLVGLELTEEQIKALLDINSADITKALNRQKDELSAATEALNKANSTIAELEKSKGDTEAMQKQIDAYREADEKRMAAEKAAAEKAEMMERMGAVMGDRKFIHERMGEIVLEDFKAALSDKAYRGKSDKEVFDAVTLDKGYFASQAPVVPPNQPPMGDVDPKIPDKAAFFKMSFAEQAKFKAEHATEFAQLFRAPDKPN